MISTLRKFKDYKSTWKWTVWLYVFKMQQFDHFFIFIIILSVPLDKNRICIFVWLLLASEFYMWLFNTLSLVTPALDV